MPADQEANVPAMKRFHTTRWSLILAARDRGQGGAHEALAALCETYWYPLYAFVRSRGHDAESAQDLVQGFFTRLLERGDLATVDPGKGKFRSFLMAACSHYLANQADHDRAKKRGGGRPLISIDRLKAEGRYGLEPVDLLTAERLFERQWALILLEQVLGQLEAEMVRSGKARQFEVLRPVLLGSALRVPYAEVAAALGVSEQAARASAQRLRRRYRVLLRGEVARTLDDPSEVDEEILALFAALGG
ncbi:ECF-type sigma factor [Singulisphaera sp. Ch08]|uniref:ECF-type sigma factor n=1 Tax=Singulisphaera sp. Ch08 TaxID=3120278 RepID=A0AAU7CKP3_9BACT